MTTLCLDNTFVSHYLDGKPYTKEFLQGLSSNTEVYIPHLVCYEAYVPAFKESGSRSLQKAAHALSGFHMIGFDHEHAKEAAKIRADLIERGQKIGAPDVLIAGVARQMDADIVSSDGHFDRVSNLNVIDPKE